MNQVLMRSINTSLTSLLPVGSILFIGGIVQGVRTLQDFALALFVGIAAGTYSSIFVASPLLAMWKEGEDHWQQVRSRVEGKPLPAIAGAADGAVAKPKKAPTLEGGTFDSRPSVAPGASPRPPKKKRRR